MRNIARLCSLAALAAGPVVFGAGEVWTVGSQEEWAAATEAKADFKLEEGRLQPTADEASFRSVLKSWKEKRKAKSITIEQIPDWLNWSETENLGPPNLQDAPVFLSLGPDNYWMFGRYGKLRGADGHRAKKAKLEGFDVPLLSTADPRQFNAPGGLKKSRGGYHAWQSRDMVNWVHHGPVTEGFSKWVTTAEYADGKFYIYYDYPNDQDPHVYVDTDLTDGEPGKNMGLAFDDPSDGSDCSVIRDRDGAFHVIYEDWSPINAKSHSWDSPLGGRAVSKTGLGGFKIVDPVVDERTRATGKTATYPHPHWKQHPDWDSNIATYEVHEPEQNAFGDWAAISVGGQYYLFADFHPANEKIRVGWFTSPSLDQPFRRCGSIGTGHPDPDIGFAEGRFYLITQMKKDYTSPGPWVDTVSVRVGVDTSGDGKADSWGEWSEVRETYDYVDGFAKQVDRTPAKLDLSGLPEGFGFQFEIRTKKSTDNGVLPVVDRVSIDF
ncbi:hypothetical protein HAHE_07330 [Haloferula helveola]|uniref:Glycosyl hydrolases family 43 n=1 Tax=Haloferula helveola TaxID=490095 RepID=A0ABM7R7N1_9BACT|nr:hypothetical protein HAHE_07330 [Haloferula helveola]